MIYKLPPPWKVLRIRKKALICEKHSNLENERNIIKKLKKLQFTEGQSALFIV